MIKILLPTITTIYLKLLDLQELFYKVSFCSKADIHEYLCGSKIKSSEICSHLQNAQNLLTENHTNLSVC